MNTTKGVKTMTNSHFTMSNNELTYNAIQLENIVNKTVPLIAKKEDEEFFRWYLTEVGSKMTRPNFNNLIKNLLEATYGA